MAKLVPKIIEDVEKLHLGVDGEVALFECTSVCVGHELEEAIDERGLHVFVFLVMFMGELPYVSDGGVGCRIFVAVVRWVGARVGWRHWILAVGEVRP